MSTAFAKTIIFFCLKSFILDQEFYTQESIIKRSKTVQNRVNFIKIENFLQIKYPELKIFIDQDPSSPFLPEKSIPHPWNYFGSFIYELHSTLQYSFYIVLYSHQTAIVGAIVSLSGSYSSFRCRQFMLWKSGGHGEWGQLAEYKKNNLLPSAYNSFKSWICFFSLTKYLNYVQEI